MGDHGTDGAAAATAAAIAATTPVVAATALAIPRRAISLPVGGGGTSRWSPLIRVARRPVERLLGLDAVNATYRRCAAGSGGDLDSFLSHVLADVGVEPVVADSDLARVPRAGPVVVVANHPYGAIDGIMLGRLLRAVRPDVRLMATYHLGQLPAIRDLFVLVDNFAAAGGAVRMNRRALTETLDWLRAGHVLAVFPAGEVAHYDLHQRRIVEGPWSETVARLARRTGAAVVPVHFDGTNSALFHLAGLVNPRLRTLLLAREVYNKRDRQITVRVGRAIPHRTIRAIAGDAELMAYLKLRTTMLASRTADGRLRRVIAGLRPLLSWRAHPKAPQPIVPAAPADLVAREVADLPADARLCETDDLVTYVARANQVPRTLREIGRLREVTFRAVGEGTGNAIDLDEFDAYYLHLFVWHKPRGEVVAAYRVGQTDHVRRLLGKRGLYTHSLFRYRTKLLREMGPALELGRSFVRPEYQRGYAPLLMLWKGIGAYVVRHPRYRCLFGPVSITKDYHDASRQLMVAFLRESESRPDLARLVRPRTPFKQHRIPDLDAHARRVVCDIDAVNEVVADVETDEKGVPILVKQYLKLGGKFLGFNVDPGFGDCVDGLVLVDLTTADRRALARYMGPDGLASFLAHHGITAPTRKVGAGA